MTLSGWKHVHTVGFLEESPRFCMSGCVRGAVIAPCSIGTIRCGALLSGKTTVQLLRGGREED